MMTRQQRNKKDARLRKELEASKSIVSDSQHTLSLRDVKMMLAARLDAPQKAVDDENRLVAELVDEALIEHSSTEQEVGL